MKSDAVTHRSIDEDTFRRANAKRVAKATSLCVISDELQEIRNLTYCKEYRRGEDNIPEIVPEEAEVIPVNLLCYALMPYLIAYNHPLFSDKERLKWLFIVALHRLNL